MKVNILLRTIKETVVACPKYSISIIIVLIVLGFMPSINLYLTAEIISLFESNSLDASISEHLFFWGLALLIPSILNPLIAFLQSNINQYLSYSLTTKLMKKSASFVGISIFEDTKFQNDINTLNKESKFRPTNFIVTLVTLIREITVVITLTFMLGNLIWWAPFLMFLAAIPLSWINLKVASYSWKALVSVGEHSRMLEYLSSLNLSKETQKDIKIYNADKLILRKYEKAFSIIQTKLFNSSIKVFSKPIPFQLLMISTISIILYGIFIAMQTSALDVASIVIIFNALVLMHGRLESIVQYGNLLTEIMPYFNKYFAYIDYREKVEIGTQSINSINSVEFKNVYFKYPHEQKYTLKNISFKVTKGESVSIVGHNGAGKSTITYLLTRFWDATKGQIKINGTDIKQFDPIQLRKCISSVPQNHTRFNFTLGENITLSENYDDTEVLDIVKKIDLKPNLSTNTLLGKLFGGQELSGGNWQKTAIGRCFFKNSSMIILDEPTSSIDPQNEAEIYKMFSALSKDKLCFTITHRMGAVNLTNRVIVLDQGQIVQDGEPNMLKATNGPFKVFWDSQAQMYKSQFTDE
ncbi:ABC transporter ATP-binding protein [Gayadomonas joobiniege]|uniref:ABC transporter ATP-binding protein n=1 Tax=Gayadomonas joobiniege TaxID=1234606 RepID=UPI0003796A8A|nr:ABC transporter ATP-binding protein [Gayadomonas joobiniege]